MLIYLSVTPDALAGAANVYNRFAHVAYRVGPDSRLLRQNLPADNLSKINAVHADLLAEIHQSRMAVVCVLSPLIALEAALCALLRASRILHAKISEPDFPRNIVSLVIQGNCGHPGRL